MLTAKDDQISRGKCLETIDNIIANICHRRMTSVDDKRLFGEIALKYFCFIRLTDQSQHFNIYETKISATRSCKQSPKGFSVPATVFFKKIHIVTERFRKVFLLVLMWGNKTHSAHTHFYFIYSHYYLISYTPCMSVNSFLQWHAWAEKELQTTFDGIFVWKADIDAALVFLAMFEMLCKSISLKR